MKDNGFTTPPAHIGFKAKKLFGDIGNVTDGAIAYISPKGGGPTEAHTHPHDHLFIVVSGEAVIEMGSERITLGKDESCLVKGNIPHSVWNPTASETVMIGLTVTDLQ